MEENPDLEEDEVQQPIDPGELHPEPDAARQSGYFNLHVIIHNSQVTTDDPGEIKDTEAYARSLLEPLFRITDCSVQEGKWIPKTLSVDLILYVEKRRGFEVAEAELEKEWFNNITAAEFNRHLWLETDFGHPTDDSLSFSKHGVAVCQMSLGTFTSTDIYSRHWQSDQFTPDENDTSPSYSPLELGSEAEELAESLENQRLERADIKAEFEHDTQTILIKHTDSNSETWKMEIAYDKLEKFILINVRDSIHHLYFFINSQPKVFKQVSGSHRMLFDLEDMDDLLEQEEREVQFGTCSRKVIGSSNMLHLAISERERNLKHLKLRFAKLGFSLLLSNPKVHKASDSVVPWLPFKTFDVSFSWFCLLSRGFRVTDQITSEFLSVVKCAIDDPDLEEILNLVTAAFDRSCICYLKETFHEEMKHFKQREISAQEKELQIPHVVKVRRILLTPSTVRGLGAEWTIENRVVREFGADRFVRIVIRDEDFQLLSPSVRLNSPMRVVTEFLSHSLTIGERQYRFLGCSNSQLRQHGVWMYASDGKHTVATIRKWMGDLADERCVATYVSRLGQCFSSTKDSVEVDNVDRIKDVERGNYCFTDGIGKISKSLAKKVSDALRMSCIPSAFQIRYGGCKGVVSLAPDLGDEEKMQVRKSMEKFQSKHNKLEVMQTTKPGMLHLNKQVIMLMSGLKVPNESFFHLQEVMLQRLADMLIVEEEAVSALCQSNLGLRVEVLKESGIAVTTEPFLRSVLITIYQHRFKDLLRRTRIEIPLNKGRIMMGTVDETGSLEYGQVFVQYSTDVNKQQSKKQVLTGQLVIAKNPCFHPGDLRKFEAVDVPKLYHMIDCVVFPAKGSRPHPNEMSGSDLDGDMYFVCWEELLIPPGENEVPMDFTAQTKQCLDHQVSEADMIEFIGNYIASDQVGVIANAHLVHADAKGISSKECLRLAQLHSDAVDFPKTGQYLRIPSELRPGSYPHYMMKRDKPIYTSSHVIAKLFDQCQAIEQSNSHKEKLPVQVDEDLLVPGYEKYLESARMLRDFYERQIGELMAVYGIDSEAALLSVTVLKIQERRGYLKGDHFEIAEIVRLKLQSNKQKLKAMFYEEFQGKSAKSNAERDESGQNMEENESDKDCTENDESVKTSRKHEILLKASALYYITYWTPDPENIDSRRNIGLPWIFWDLLIEIKKLNANACNDRTQDAIRVKWKSFLHKISADMIDAAKSLEADTVEFRRKRTTAFTKLQETVNCKKLVLFGSTASEIDTLSSNLDVHVLCGCPPEAKTENNAFQQIVTAVAEAVRGEVSKRFLENPDKKIAAVTFLENETKMQVVLYSSTDCLQRTAYIVAATVLNKWMVPALKVALAWARNNGLVGDARECSLKAEQFVIMFYYITLHKYEFGCSVSAEAQRLAAKLLEENHYLNCSILECHHIDSLPDETSVAESLAQLSFSCRRQSGTTSNPKASADPRDQPRHASASETRLGEVLLYFFRHFSTTRGKAENSILNIPDPSSENSSAKLIKKKPQQCQQIVKKMMQAHHSLANSSSIQEFLNMGFNEEGPYTVVLPSQVSSNIKYRKPYIAQKIKMQCGADMVTVREKKYRGDSRTCLVLEAWGSASALLKVSEKVRDLVASSSMFVSENYPTSRPVLSDAHRVLLEHCEGPGAKVVITPYITGPCQPGHDTLERQVVRLWNPNPMDTYDVEHFVSLFHKQREFINGSYEKDFHGELRGVISYGTYYICNCKETGMTAKDFETMVTEKQEGCYSAHFNLGKRQHRGRGRGRGRYFSQNRPDKTKYIRTAFIPTASANLKCLKELLKKHDFIQTAKRLEYRPTVKMSVPGPGGNVDGVIVLNQKFDFKSFILPDEKWLVLDTIRDKTGVNSQLKDMRFKIHSRPVRSDQDLKEYPELKKIISNTHRLLLRPSPNEEIYGVNREFKDRIKFIRYKDVREFEYRGKAASQKGMDFMHHITIRVNIGKEFTRPNPDGTFREVSEDRVEVTVIPDLPDLQDTEESEQFIQQVWQFSKEFGELLQGQL